MNLHDSLIFWGKLGSFCFNLIPLSFFLFWSNLIPLSINHLGIRQSLRLQPLLCSSIPFNLFFLYLDCSYAGFVPKTGSVSYLTDPSKMEEASAEGNAQLEVVERLLKVYLACPPKTKNIMELKVQLQMYVLHFQYPQNIFVVVHVS